MGFVYITKWKQRMLWKRKWSYGETVAYAEGLLGYIAWSSMNWGEQMWKLL